MEKIKIERISKVMFLFSIGILIFFYGVVASWYNVFPHKILTRARTQLNILKDQPIPHFLYPIRYNKSGLNIYDKNAIMPGITLITSFWPETNFTAGVRLIDVDGNILHHWEVRASKIWPQSPHKDFMRNKKNTDNNFIHGTYLYPNGDIVFNVEYMGLVRMSSSGAVKWSLPYRTHHSVFVDDDGNFWVSGGKWIEEGNIRAKEFPGLNLPFLEETILQVSPDGNLLQEISVLEALYKYNYQHLLFHYKRIKWDLLHLNDVEVLGLNKSRAFPMFSAGDILISSRGLCFIAILNQDGVIKWLSSGTFTEQHDPDFEEDGLITVFDNRMNMGASMIKKINPSTNTVQTIFPVQSNQNFYTATGGKHQKLINGNRLITEARSGRIFEITSSGKIIWEWIQSPFDSDYVPEVLEGSKYYFSTKDVSEWEKPPGFEELISYNK